MNITFSLDEDLIAASKSLAARHGTSVSALVRAALEREVAQDGVSQSAAASGVAQILIQYSMGQTPRQVALEQLGLDDYSALLNVKDTRYKTCRCLT